MNIRIALATAVAIALLPAAGDARTLRWRALEVDARLEASGELSIRERHTMVFDGDWNGGERTFRSAPGQRFVFKSISRVDPVTGKKTRLVESDPPSRVDQYAWAGPEQLRWRVRRPSDPPLRDRELIYDIEYALRYVLLQDGDVYRLDHDFAFPNRTADIERLTVSLELDPMWSVVPEGTSLTFEREDVPPGESARGQFSFRYGAATVPKFAATTASPIESEPATQTATGSVAVPALERPLDSWLISVGIFAVFLVVSRLAVNRFIAAERSIGRYETVAPSRSWLNQNILTQRPEVVGAAWDSVTSEAEAAALIALMIMEGKLSQSRGPGEPMLSLLVDRASLSDYERAFIDRLFIAGDRITPSKLKSHYASTGFSPSAALKVPLGREAERLVGSPPFLFACLTGIVGMMVTFNLLPGIGVAANDQIAGFVGAIGAIALAVTVIMASFYRSRLYDEKGARALALPATLFAMLAILARNPVIGALFTVFAFLFILFAFWIGRWNGTPEQLRNYINFRRAREFFAGLLERGERIEESWVPYILALGLGTELDRWSVAAPQRATGQWTSTDTPSGVSPSRFSGGGGTFGGAGATGGWAQGISSFASGISAPSSGRSSSGFSSGGSSGGGSRSGGGGGGGW